MKKYAKIINDETKQCEIGIGTNIPFYISIGMEEIDVEQAYNGSWYVTGYAPEKPVPIHEEIAVLREKYRKTHMDSKTLERLRKQANGTWTPQDEQAYLLLDAQVTGYIEEHYPYSDGEE